MIVRYIAEFRSSLPELGGDYLYEDKEPWGGNVAIAISEILRRIGYEVDAPQNAGDHGWDFEVRIKGYPKGARVWCTVQLISYYRLVFDNTSSWDKFRKRHPAPYIEALRALGREMAADPRFSEVHWNLPEDAVDEPSGAPQPVDD